MTTVDMENDNTFTRKPYRNENLNQVLEFARDHGLPPHHTQATFKKFLTHLCSGPEKIIEIFHRDRRVAVGVVLDLMPSPDRTVPFELLGLDLKFADGAYRALLDTAERETPETAQGMTVFHHFMHPFGDDLLLARGYKPSISTYSLMLRNPVHEDIEIATNIRLEPLKLELFDYYYELVRHAYEGSPRSTIAGREEFLRATMARPVPPLLLFENNKLSGFVTILVDERDRAIGRVDSLGVHGFVRRKGFGRLLLRHAVQALLIDKVKRVNLEISAAGTDALKIYESLGFQVVDRFAGFVLPKNPALK